MQCVSTLYTYVMTSSGRGIVVYLDYLCAKFGDFGLSHVVLSCGLTDRITYKITDTDDRYRASLTRVPAASVYTISFLGNYNVRHVLHFSLILYGTALCAHNQQSGSHPVYYRATVSVC